MQNSRIPSYIYQIGNKQIKDLKIPIPGGDMRKWHHSHTRHWDGKITLSLEDQFMFLLPWRFCPLNIPWINMCPHTYSEIILWDPPTSPRQNIFTFKSLPGAHLHFKPPSPAKPGVRGFKNDGGTPHFMKEYALLLHGWFVILCRPVSDVSTHRWPPSVCIQTTSGQSVAFSLGRGQWARLPKPTAHSRFLAGLCTSLFF